MIFRCKYGFDGTSANSYKQKWKHEDSDDSHLFCTSIVPLQLEYENGKQILWRNPLPSSTRFCRPVRLQFIKESEEVTKNEHLIIEEQIKNLKNVNISGFNIKFDVCISMIDGKVKF